MGVSSIDLLKKITPVLMLRTCTTHKWVLSLSFSNLSYRYKDRSYNQIEQAVGVEPPPRPRESRRTKQPPRSRVWAGAAAAATVNDDGDEPFFLAAAAMDISGAPNRRRECEKEMDLGK